MDDNVLREQLTTSVNQCQEQYFRLKREHSALVDLAKSGEAGTTDGSSALQQAERVRAEMLRALNVYEDALTRLSNFARESTRRKVRPVAG